MNDLPQPPVSPQTTVSGGLHKEAEKVPGGLSEVAVTPETGSVAPELEKAGVLRVHPTSIPVPEPLQKMGVMPAGENVAVKPPVQTIPLSDAKIAEGLKLSWKNSFRWLAEFSARLKKVVAHKLSRNKV